MGLLMVIAIAGIGMAGVGIVWHQESQREREKQLLFIGAEYRKAIGSYFENSPSGVKQYPQTLQELVLDKRFPTIKRHIRQLYADPFAKENQSWNLVLEQGQIRGVYSNAELTPIKKFGFASTEESFSEAATYNDWRFIYAPGAGSSIAVSNTPNAPNNLPESVQPENSQTNDELNNSNLGTVSSDSDMSGNDTSNTVEQNSASQENNAQFETLPSSINAPTQPVN